jgi:GTP-binding protein LepA
MEIVRERLEREYGLELVATAPNVEYVVHTKEGAVEVVDNPSAMPPPNSVEWIEEPYVTITVLTPKEYVGTLMELCQQRRGEMMKLEYLSEVDVLLNNVPVDAFSAIVHRDRAYEYGRRMSVKLRELIPRQMFDVPIQAAIGGRVIARETVKARRKDVLAKCYGGDISRKRKLLERQKEGKRRMKQIGRVEVPQEAFVAALRLEE